MENNQETLETIHGDLIAIANNLGFYDSETFHKKISEETKKTLSKDNKQLTKEKLEVAVMNLTEMIPNTIKTKLKADERLVASKAGIHNIDSKMILSKENEYTLNEQDQEYLTKNEQELEQELADLKNLKNTLDKQSSEQTDPRLKKQMEVGLAELTAQIEDTSLHHRVLRDINEFVGIDLQDFCEKYARRVGEDPQKLHYMFQKKAVEKLKTYNGNVEETKSELKFVAESYESIKQDDKKKYWKKANREINTLISKINNVFETDELIESQHLKKPRLSVEEGQSSRSSLLDKKDDATPEETNLNLEVINPIIVSKIEGKTGSLDQHTSQTKKTSLFRATYVNIRDLQDNLIYQKKARQLSNEVGNNGKFNNGEVENGKVDNGRLSNGQKKELRVILGDCGTQVVKIDSQSERPTASPNLVSRVNNPKGAVGYDR